MPLKHHPAPLSPICGNGSIFLSLFFLVSASIAQMQEIYTSRRSQKKAFASLGRADIQKKGNSNLALLFKKITLTTQLLSAYYQDIPAKQHKESSSESPIM